MLNQIIEFIRLSRKRSKSAEDYFEFQGFQARILIKDLKKIYNFSKISKMIDIGSGVGGYVYELAKQFPRKKIISLDKNPLNFAKKKLKRFRNVKLVKGDATKMPFKNNSIDFVMASSVIEHVQNQKLFLKEISRVLKNNGACYISFPPYYSLRGGHAISPFHYLPGNTGVKLYSKLKIAKEKGDFIKNYDLVKTTLRSFKKIAKENFKIIEVKTRILTFLKPLLIVPIINEFVCYHVEFFLVKK